VLRSALTTSVFMKSLHPSVFWIGFSSQQSLWPITHLAAGKQLAGRDYGSSRRLRPTLSGTKSNFFSAVD
jgi:hypothetical protein